MQELREKSKNGVQLLDMLTHINRVLQENVSTVKVPFIISSLKKRVFFGPIDHQRMDAVPEGILYNLIYISFNNNNLKVNLRILMRIGMTMAMGMNVAMIVINKSIIKF